MMMFSDHNEELEEMQATRTQLWRLACSKQITADQLYAELTTLRQRAGDQLYQRTRQERPERRR